MISRHQVEAARARADAASLKVSFGDHVICLIEGVTDYGYVVGTMAYSPDGNVVLLSNDEAIGMPVNVHWLEKQGTPDISKAKVLRRRYLDAFGEKWLAAYDADTRTDNG